MFVYSVKTSKAKIAALLIGVCAVIIALFLVIGRGKRPVADDSAVNYKASTAAERTAFLSQFGWKISEDPVEICEVIIPEDFEAGYSEYAEMNKAQGFDLEPYKGMRAKKWTYDILNYPGLENKSGIIQANILIFEGRVIGGDICSLEEGGFINGFDFPSAPATTQPASEAQTVTNKAE